MTVEANGDAVWITGTGLATPLGLTFDTLMDNLLAGRSGVGPLTKFDPVDHSCRVAASLGSIPSPEGWDPAEFARLSDWEQLMLFTAVNALRDSGWWERRHTARIGMVVGVGAEWAVAWEASMRAGGRQVYTPEADRQGLTATTRDALGLTGPIATVAAACASGNVALAQARRWVRLGWVDVCLAGACDRALTPMAMASFGNLGALSKRNDDPSAASRPFDRGRDGFVMGEGGAMFVLERAESARRRGARAYAEIAGVGATSDAHHLVIPSSNPDPCIRAIRLALEDGRLDPADLDYVNAHATSTPVGDAFESRAVRAVLGPAVERVPVSATKSMTGHLLTAAAAVEALACLGAMARSAIPPTINLHDPDPECDLRHVANQAIEQPVRTALSNSFGFGGSNFCVLFRQVA
ncbi:MAG: beta-ketoacyl-[acyl-carrier-protein] synthase family protein [Isosphaeraceae bacterium]